MAIGPATRTSAMPSRAGTEAMGEIVNLRTARKQRRRAEERVRATEAAALNGERPADLARREAEAERDRRRLDGHRRERPDDEAPS